MLSTALLNFCAVCCEHFAQGNRASLWSRLESLSDLPVYVSLELSGRAQWSGSVSIVHAVMDEVSTNGGSFWRKIVLPCCVASHATIVLIRRASRRRLDVCATHCRRNIEAERVAHRVGVLTFRVSSYPHSRINKFIYVFCRIILSCPWQM